MGTRISSKRTQKAREASMARSHEEKSAAAKKSAMHRDREELRRTLLKAREASQARSQSEKSAAAKKAAQTRNREELESTLAKARAMRHRRMTHQASMLKKPNMNNAFTLLFQKIRRFVREPQQ